MFELNYEAREKKTRMAEVWQAAEKSAKLGSKIESNLERNGGVLEKTVEKEVDYTPKRRLSGEKIPRRKKGFLREIPMDMFPLCGMDQEMVSTSTRWPGLKQLAFLLACFSSILQVKTCYLFT